MASKRKQSQQETLQQYQFFKPGANISSNFFAKVAELRTASGSYADLS